MTHSSLSYDVIVVGGGPAGLMAAIAAQTHGATTLLIEKGNKLARKLGISGGGRCNVTNAKPLTEFIQNIPGNGRFLHSALVNFSNDDIQRFFEALGIRLKEEDRGRVFPVSDKASTVVQALINHASEVGVEVWEDMRVSKLLTKDNRIQGVLLANETSIFAPAVIVATGGSSVPKTGSTGDAYPWAKAVGHEIISPFPTEVPLTSDDAVIRQRSLQGLSLQAITMTIRNAAGKKLTTEHGDLIFTHFGLSGPVALRCSHYVSTAIRKGQGTGLTASIDLAPDRSAGDIRSDLDGKRSREPKRHLSNILRDWFPERLTAAILGATEMNGQVQISNTPNRDLEHLANTMKAFPIGITGTLPLSQATVTGGGVSVREIHPQTMESRICSGLYFAGEVMDVHAHTGGYNITVAFSTGHLAGTSAAEQHLSHKHEVQ